MPLLLATLPGFVKFFVQGGFFMFVLLILSIFSLAVILQRARVIKMDRSLPIGVINALQAFKGGSTETLERILRQEPSLSRAFWTMCSSIATGHAPKSSTLYRPEPAMRFPDSNPAWSSSRSRRGSPPARTPRNPFGTGQHLCKHRRGSPDGGQRHLRGPELHHRRTRRRGPEPRRLQLLHPPSGGGLDRVGVVDYGSDDQALPLKVEVRSFARGIVALRLP